ncbi:hypothetical protein WJX81_007465 [Elliptochloris bilobata]|uniref:Uncharacterized protein n=1 Tax=Elliptochloris bilobata TaxID=381761 RepID=A0AAW1QM38_9CHLO
MLRAPALNLAWRLLADGSGAAAEQPPAMTQKSRRAQKRLQRKHAEALAASLAESGTGTSLLERARAALQAQVDSEAGGSGAAGGGGLLPVVELAYQLMPHSLRDPYKKRSMRTQAWKKALTNERRAAMDAEGKGQRMRGRKPAPPRTKEEEEARAMNKLAKLELYKQRQAAVPMVADYAQLMTDLPPSDAVYLGFNPVLGGGGGRRGVVVAAAVQEPVLAPGQAELEAVKGVLQSRLPLGDKEVDTLLRTAYELQDGLSRSAKHARKPLPSPDQVTAVLDLLTVDFASGHPKGLASVLKRCADLLSADVDKQLRAVRDFLLFAGFSSAQVAGAVYKTPRVLLRDVTNDLLPTYEYLSSLGLADDDLTGILRACPKLMVLPLKAELRTNVALLVGSGLVGADLGRVISVAPQALSLRMSVLTQHLAFVRSHLGGTVQDIVALPQLLITDLQRVQSRIAVLALHGRSIELPTQVAAAEAGAPPAAQRMPSSAAGHIRAPTFQVRELMKLSAAPVPLGFVLSAGKTRWKRFCRLGLGQEGAGEASAAAVSEQFPAAPPSEEATASEQAPAAPPSEVGLAREDPAAALHV